MSDTFIPVEELHDSEASITLTVREWSDVIHAVQYAARRKSRYGLRAIHPLCVAWMAGLEKDLGRMGAMQVFLSARPKPKAPAPEAPALPSRQRQD